jgi:glyoxylase I family protein
VSDLDRSIYFNQKFDFEILMTWSAEDKSLQIVHLVLNGFILELFCYAENTDTALRQREVGNDLEEVGAKHFALQVQSLVEARERLESLGVDCITRNAHGRTGIDYFFVRDPDGLWLEVVEDHR